MKYWLMKSEPEAFSIDDLERDGKTSWDGVRNFQARNFMREMKVGDKVLFYASSADPSGITGGRERRSATRTERRDLVDGRPLAMAYTDAVITTGSTRAKAAHINELRNALR